MVAVAIFAFADAVEKCLATDAKIAMTGRYSRIRMMGTKMTTKLDELKALLARHQENPDYNTPRYQLKEELYANASALIAAVEALKRLLDIVEPDPRRRWAEGSEVNRARAALAPFGE